MHRTDVFYCGTQRQLGNFRDGIIKHWPTLNLSIALDLTRDVPAYQRFVVNGKNAIFEQMDPWGQIHRQGVSTSMLPWRCSPEILVWPEWLRKTRDIDVTTSVLRDDVHPPAWAGVRVVAQASGQVKKQVDDYWVDSDRGHLVMEHYTQGDVSGTLPDFQETAKVLETSKTDMGNWYPVRIRYQKKFTVQIQGKSTLQQRQIEDRITLDTGWRPEGDVFKSAASQP